MADTGGLLSDSPVGGGLREDRLKFSSYAKVLAEAAVNTQGPITIGIFGGWGAGKTSLMRLIQKEVEKKSDRAAAVWFNAWQYEKEEHLIVPLTATVRKGLERTWPEKLAQGAKSMGDALRSIAYGFSIKGKIGVPLISEAEVNLSPKDMIERYQSLTKDAVLARSLYFDAFEALETCARECDAPRVVVFVDDLDRCFPPKAVELLEGIKLVLDQPGFSFILGVNDAIIQAFVTTKYEKDFHIDPSYFVDYLDKIVQVKVPVPRRKPGDMTDYILELIQKGGVLSKAAARDAVSLIAEACNRNPRSIVRMLNRIIVTSRIEREDDNEDYDPPCPAAAHRHRRSPFRRFSQGPRHRHKP